MSREKAKEWLQIGAITKQWVKASYSNADAQSAWKYKDRMNEFLGFLGLTDSEFVEGYKRAKDRLEWAKQMGLKAVAFYNSRVQKGYATNTVRAEVSTVRAFCRDNCTTLIVPRKKIAKAKSAKGEHEFTQAELAKMFYVADVRAKAVLATGISLGFSVEDFSELKRDFIESLVNKSQTEKIDFIGFNYERGKTGVESRSHLTPEAVNSLKAWFEYTDQKRVEENEKRKKENEGKAEKDKKPLLSIPSEWVWCNGNGNHLNEQTLNDIIKDLVQKANITTTGKVRFHLIRKFLMDALHDAKFDSWETKRALGKEIPTSDDTYLKGLSRTVSEKFPTAYDHIRLTGYANKNGTRIEDLEQKIQQLEINLENMAVENQTLRRIIEYSIPKDKVQDAINRLANEYGVFVAKQSGEPMNLNELIEALQQLKAKTQV